MRSGDSVRHTIHCRASKIVAQGHPFAVPAMERSIFLAAVLSARTIFGRYGEFLLFVQPPAGVFKSEIVPEYLHLMQFADIRKICCTT